ncbi:hypothetical protein [Candidatus Poriferisocius sp.]|uniref:hypothetical protein n=1 Tax=Candidatus Poriferisocius sp. TaxID=3101276 RepID=UPI003B023D45
MTQSSGSGARPQTVPPPDITPYLQPKTAAQTQRDYMTRIARSAAIKDAVFDIALRNLLDNR